MKENLITGRIMAARNIADERKEKARRIKEKTSATKLKARTKLKNVKKCNRRLALLGRNANTKRNEWGPGKGISLAG